MSHLDDILRAKRSLGWTSPDPEEEMVDGYRDGFSTDSLEPGENRSASYLHGFANGRDDLMGIPGEGAAVKRARAHLLIDTNPPTKERSA